MAEGKFSVDEYKFIEQHSYSQNWLDLHLTRMA